MYFFKKFLVISLLAFSFNNVFSMDNGDTDSENPGASTAESNKEELNSCNKFECIKKNLDKFFTNYIKNKHTYEFAKISVCTIAGYYFGKYKHNADFNQKINDFAKNTKQKIKNSFNKIKNNPKNSLVAGTLTGCATALGFYAWKNFESKK